MASFLKSDKITHTLSYLILQKKASLYQKAVTLGNIKLSFYADPKGPGNFHKMKN